MREAACKPSNFWGRLLSQLSCTHLRAAKHSCRRAPYLGHLSGYRSAAAAAALKLAMPRHWRQDKRSSGRLKASASTRRQRPLCDVNALYLLSLFFRSLEVWLTSSRRSGSKVSRSAARFQSVALLFGCCVVACSSLAN